MQTYRRDRHLGVTSSHQDEVSLFKLNELKPFSAVTAIARHLRHL